MMRVLKLLILTTTCFLLTCTTENPLSSPQVHTVEFLSPAFHIDRIYRSMEGPSHTLPVSLSTGGPAELAWITAIHMESVDLEGNLIDAQDKLCHVNVNFTDPNRWQENSQKLFGGKRGSPAKWFVLVQGQYSVDFPEGLGIPVYTDEPLEMFSMAFNLDPEVQDLDMRLRLRLDYLKHSELTKPMTALSRSGLANSVDLDSAGAIPEHDEPSSCSLHADEGTGRPSNARSVTTDSSGKRTTTHFMVPPGRHVYRDEFRLGGDQKVHYMHAHLHLYGESVELVDEGTGESVFKSVATPNKGLTGIDNMTHFSSSASSPITLQKDHTYALVSTYHNTTDHDIDAMAMLYIYFENGSFHAPPPSGG